MLDKTLCAGGAKGESVCRGDSGGPLMQFVNPKYDLVGVVSFGFGRCAQAGKPAVFTNVWSYDDWIRNNIDKEV